MRVLVTGSNGQLGSALVSSLKQQKFDYYAAHRDNMNLEVESDIRSALLNFNPDIVFHCAAYTNVEKAENEKEICHAINVDATRIIGEMCKEINAKLIYISTDFVFDGLKKIPYTPLDQANPINYYGKTKYDGELELLKLIDKCFIVRTSWVFGHNGNNFVNKILELCQSKNELNVTFEEIGSPTFVNDLVDALMKLINSDKYGIYHLSNQNYCSRYEFANEIVKISNLKTKIFPVKSNYYSSKVNRPKFTALSQELNPDNSIIINRNWKDALNAFIKERV
jgi:dTDP-4-dehydrorhamnose reductase